MSAPLGDRLPTAVMSALSAAARERPEGQCVILVTVDPEGQARPCLLSVGELLAVDDRKLRAVIWPDSKTTQNLDSGRSALFTLACPPDVFHVRAEPRRLAAAPHSQLARFEFTVCSVEADTHSGMPVTQPMWFAARADLHDSVLVMWASQLDALRYRQ